MSITIELTPEIEGQLRRQADSRGVPVDRYAASLIQEKVATIAVDPTRKEWLARWNKFYGSVKGIPPLTPESMRREHLYNTDKDGNYVD